MIETILIADDEPLMRSFLEETLTRQGFSVTTAEDGKRALAYLKNGCFDLLITDVRMPGLTGIELLRKCRELSPQTLAIVMTAYGSIEDAVEAMQLGAFHYLLKPFTPDAIETVIAKAREHHALVQENTFLRQEVSGKAHQKIIAESPIMQKILKEVVKVAGSQASVLIHGESGTGKEVIAAAIHAHSPRAQNPYVRVNCAAVPDTLVESEFFGHEKGAFTGAHAKRPGRFELANKGTLLLDEVSEIPLPLQPKLLRAIQEQEFERVGGIKPISVDIRLLSTSNRNLKEAIASKIFREDLYYRLNVVPIYLPPLRDRREDILPLADYFLTKFSTTNHLPLKRLSPAAKKALLAYSWPGNVRELANVIERAVVLSETSKIAPPHLHLVEG